MSEEKVTEIPTQANRNIKDFLFSQVEPSWFKICIEGKIIPRMLGRMSDGRCEILLDDRWVYIFDTIEAAYSACSMAANAMAIGEGYPFLGAENKNMPFAPTIRMIGETS